MGEQQTLFDAVGTGPALCEPLIKYAGSKRWLVKILALRLHARLAAAGATYVEPFAGSLAMGLALGWSSAVYADTNPDVANLHRAVVATPDEVSDALETLAGESGEETYYKIRESVWPGNREKLSTSVLAARTIWLNKNCFNGLTRYSLKGRFNVPWGDREGVALPSREHVRGASAALRGSKVFQQDFVETLAHAAREDVKRLVVYLDPPYGAKLKNVSTRGARARGGDNGVFTAYAGAFTWDDQVRLAGWARNLAAAGALVVASNSWDDDVCDLYRDGFALFQVGVQHSFVATGDRRGKRAEMLAVSEAHAGVVDSIPVKVARKR